MSAERSLIKNLLSNIANLYGSAMSGKTVSVTLKMCDVEKSYLQSKSGSSFLVPMMINDCSVVVQYQPHYITGERHPIKLSITRQTLTFSDFDTQHTDQSNERKIFDARGQALIDATAFLMKDSTQFTIALQNLCGLLHGTFKELEYMRTAEFGAFSE